MTKPHKHAEAIKAWADGKQIQWAEPICPTSSDPLAPGTPDWKDVPLDIPPTWSGSLLFRVKPEPKWRKEREAFAHGERIQWRSTSKQHAGMAWRDVPPRSPMGLAFDEPTNEFRIKPKVETIRHCLIRNSDGSVRAGNAKTESAEKALEARSDFMMWCGPRKEVVTESNPIVAFGVDPGAAGGDECYFVARMADGTIQHWKFR